MSLSLDEPGPYSVELIVTDKAGNSKTTRRIIMFDNKSVIEKTGKEPNITQSEHSGWINASTSNIEVQWTGRYRNVRHANHGWLNSVAYDETISRDLEDVTGRSLRTVDRIHNIEGNLPLIAIKKHLQY